jgi:hypothetical protein
MPGGPTSLLWPLVAVGWWCRWCWRSAAGIRHERALAGRRDEVVIATKLGYTFDGDQREITGGSTPSAITSGSACWTLSIARQAVTAVSRQ